jgi:hypothetical protein
LISHPAGANASPSAIALAKEAGTSRALGFEVDGAITPVLHHHLQGAGDVEAIKNKQKRSIPFSFFALGFVSHDAKHSSRVGFIPYVGPRQTRLDFRRHTSTFPHDMFQDWI